LLTTNEGTSHQNKPTSVTNVSTRCNQILQI